MGDRLEIQFLPLELWRASALAQETKTIIAAYERCLATGDGHGLIALRRAIERRIDDLEAFYIANVDDERSVLFEKQRLRLRKLLSEYDGISAGAVGGGAALPSAAPPAAMSASAAPASAGPAYLTSGSSSSAGAAAMAGFASAGGYGAYGGPSTGAGYSLGGGPSGAGSAPGSIGPGGSSLPGAGSGHASAAAAAAAAGAGTITKEIREDTRLTLSELLAWFTQAGVAEMPEVAPEYVEAVFANVTRTNMDGKMSVRDLRQWYITFGKRAIREGLPLHEIVSVAFVRATAAAAVTARKDASVHDKKRGVVDLIASGLGASAGAGSGLGASGTLGSSGLLAGTGAGGAASGSGAAGSGGEPFPPGPLVLPNGMLEFQVRLTPEEYAQVGLLRRRLEAEAKYKARMAAAKDRASAARGDRWAPGAGLHGWGTGPGGVGGAAQELPVDSYPTTSLLNLGPYEDPSIKNSYFFRSP